MQVASKLKCLSKVQSREEGCGESGSDLAPSDPELDSTVVVWSRINPRKESKNEDKDAVYPEIQKLLDEPVPSGSKDDCGTPSRSKPKVGMNINKVMKSGSSSKIADSRSYTYDHIVLGEAEWLRRLPVQYWWCGERVLTSLMGRRIVHNRFSFYYYYSIDFLSLVYYSCGEVYPTPESVFFVNKLWSFFTLCFSDWLGKQKVIYGQYQDNFNGEQKGKFLWLRFLLDFFYGGRAPEEDDFSWQRWFLELLF